MTSGITVTTIQADIPPGPPPSQAPRGPDGLTVVVVAMLVVAVAIIALRVFLRRRSG